MAVNQGTTPFNTEYFTALTNRVNAAGSCGELQALVTESFSSIQGVSTAIEAQVAALAPILSLLTAPAANPAAIVTWLSTFITSYLTPYVVPYTTMAAQLTALASAVSSLTSAISSAEAKFSGCSITVPPIT
jgi:hypothetical protein